jgi:mevalonate kinase
MKIKAFAPGKVILFGEHSVVHKKPAIAVAINRGVNVELTSRTDNMVEINVPVINYSSKSELVNKKLIFELDSQNKMITDYIYEVINLFEFEKGFNLTVDIKMYLGAGLGSSAAVTVATLAALYRYHNMRFNKQSLAHDAHMVEQAVQGVASPLDTLVSTYGGLVYLSRNKKVEHFNVNFNVPFVVGYTTKHGNTGKMVKDVKNLKTRNPKIINPVITSMGNLTNYAKQAILKRDFAKIGELMNINHGFLDVLGVNTLELSRMVYNARNAGAIGAKTTGAGGGGSIIALCPGKVDEVARAIDRDDNILKIRFTRKGVSSRVYK